MSVEPAATIDHEAYRWVVRLDRGLTPDERLALDAWMAEDDRKRGAFIRAQAVWSTLDRARALAGGAEEREVIESAAADSPSWNRRRLLGLGGSAAAVVVAGGLIWAPWSRGQAFATTTGEVRRLPLEDGSLTVINSASGIRVSFTRDRRNVELRQGEAWFKVAKNPARPFTVTAGAVRVEAVGTAFDVRRRDGRVEVIVTEGVVKVWSNAAGDDLTLVHAGHRAVVGERTGVQVAALSASGLDQQLAWQEGRIVLDNMMLGDAAAEFNRYNETKLEIAPALAREQVVGWFRFDDLEGFVQATATLVGGRVEREGNTVRIVE